MGKKKRIPPETDLQRLEKIKRLVIIALFSDDRLMERLVLKGGNALDLVHRISARASIDVDLSMESDFDAAERYAIAGRIEGLLKATFRASGYEAFDVAMEEKPENLTPDMADFWGGYRVKFKLVQKVTFDRLSPDLAQLRINAMRLGQGANFLIDISKFEYTTGKEPRYLDGYRIFVYTPEMIVAEKLRAICQQTPEYSRLVKRNRPGSARARDFVDIQTVVTERAIDMTTKSNLALLSNVFAAKKVPLSLLGEIENYREFHRADFPAVMDAAKPGVTLKEFDFYFDFVIGLIESLKPLWNV